MEPPAHINVLSRIICVEHSVVVLHNKVGCVVLSLVPGHLYIAQVEITHTMSCVYARTSNRQC